MLIFISFLFISGLTSADTSVMNLCGNSNPQSIVTSPFAHETKYQWCFGGVCEENGKVFERQKCIKLLGHGDDEDSSENSFMVLHKDLHEEPGLSSMKSYGAFYRLYPDDACFEPCRPEEKSFLGMKTGKRVGLEKEECRNCMIKLPPKDADSYEVKGHGVTVYQGQKCFGLCRLPAGPYLDHRPYSNECLSCIGTMGIKPVTEHLMNKAGECFELQDGRYQGARKVPEWLCKEDQNLYETYYSKSSKFAVDTLIFKKPQKCYEVDGKTGGQYYKHVVNMANCDPQATNTSDRGNNKESSSTIPRNKSSSSSAIKN